MTVFPFSYNLGSKYLVIWLMMKGSTCAYCCTFHLSFRVPCTWFWVYFSDKFHTSDSL